MQRHMIGQRPDWEAKLEEQEFDLGYMYGELYWDERKAYQFSLAEIENNIEDPSMELHRMCYEAAEKITADKDLMNRMAIPELYHDAVRRSWERNEKDLYGRFDLMYDGLGPAKLLEYNADTPTSLFETGVLQWQWMEEQRENREIPETADQYNSVHERLIMAFKALKVHNVKGEQHSFFHFAGVLDNQEDYLTLKYLSDCAFQADFQVTVMDMSQLGYDKDSWFVDLESNQIDNLFKLYPLEHMMREEFGPKLISSPTRMFEPLWKSVISNKGILPVLWDMFPDHPNLLPAYFLDDPKHERITERVVKPLFSREGANITIDTKNLQFKTEGDYGAEGFIVQEAAKLAKFEDDYAVIGSWIIAGEAAGMCIREDTGPVTQDLSRFVPHFIYG